ncbi:unnamed protein product [Closterium sp. NIES-65]|nr:unnamed protein product [Closterium sp. NIES-65]
MRPSEIALEPPSADVPSPSAFLPPMSPESIPLGLSSLRSLSALSATPLWPPPPIAEWPRAAVDHGPRIAAAAVDVADRLLSTVPPLLTQALTSAAGGVHRYLQRFSVYVIIANAARPVLRPAVDKAQEVLDKTTTMPIRLLWLCVAPPSTASNPTRHDMASAAAAAGGRHRMHARCPRCSPRPTTPPTALPRASPSPRRIPATHKISPPFLPIPTSPALSLRHPTLPLQIPPMSTIPGRLVWLAVLLLLAWAACTLPSLLSTLHDPQYYSASPFPRRIPVLGDGGSAPVFSNAGFNVEAAAKMWEAKVGCARFRWKHRDLLKKYSYSSAFPKSSSLQDPNRVACRRMQLRHVTILLPPGAESWMWPHKLEGFYHCPRCGITCQISWSPLMALQADATLHVWPADPPADRSRGQPLRVYLNLESWGLLEKRRLFDVGVSPFASSDVQLTYSGVHHTLETGRRQFFSKIKRQVRQRCVGVGQDRTDPATVSARDARGLVHHVHTRGLVHHVHAVLTAPCLGTATARGGRVWPSCPLSPPGQHNGVKTSLDNTCPPSHTECPSASPALSPLASLRVPLPFPFACHAVTATSCLSFPPITQDTPLYRASSHCQYEWRDEKGWRGTCVPLFPPCVSVSPSHIAPCASPLLPPPLLLPQDVPLYRASSHCQYEWHEGLDVPLYRASSHCQYEWREGLVRDVFALVPHHSFGHCDNNMNGSDAELLLYPACSHPMRSIQKTEITACALSPPRPLPSPFSPPPCELIPFPSSFSPPPRVISVLKQEISACAMSHYKFILSTENTRVPGYVTEKALEPLEAGTVPVYYGAPDIRSFMPPESFIDGSKYTAAQLATLITALNNDPGVLFRLIQSFSGCLSGATGAFGEALEAGTVPMYYGAPDIHSFMPPDSFIDGSNYTAARLATLIAALNNDPLSVPVYQSVPDIHQFMPPESFIDDSKYTAALLTTLITALSTMTQVHSCLDILF